jgi:hypothetical protein
MQFDTLLSKAKAEFNKDFETQDYGAAINYLNSAIKLNPKNAEAHYCLAYSYSRFNSKDATNVPKMALHLVAKATNELQKVINLSPKYNGPLLILDPYSKITSEWGSLSFSYLTKNKPDSAIWALKEGKKQGGFDDFILSVNRAVLNSCSKNAILISSGDNYTLPLNYLQKIENLRTDVSVVDIAMLNTTWYPTMLQKQSAINFGIPEKALDSLDYITWADSTISIPTSTINKPFTWVMKPSYQQTYILRGDRLALLILQRNQFKRDVYFTKGFIKTDQLGLDNYLLLYPMVDKLNFNNNTPLSLQEYTNDLKKHALTFTSANKNSNDELVPIDFIRYDLIDLFDEDVLSTDPVKVKQLLEILNTYIPEYKYPCNSVDISSFLNFLNK